MKNYEFLEQVFIKVRHISEIMEGLYRSKMCGADEILDKINTLREIRQDIIDSDVVSEAIGTALSNKRQLGDWEVANLYCISRIHRILKGVPVGLSSSLAKAKMDCLSSWTLFSEGRESLQNVVGTLSEVVKLSSELASVKSSDMGVENKYDVMLKSYDGDMDTKRVDEVFTDLGAFFRQFFGEVLDRQGRNKVHVAKSVPLDRQKAFHEYIRGTMCSGVDVPAEALCWDSLNLVEWPDECVFYDESDYRTGLRGTLESIGRFLYQAHLPKKWISQPVGRVSGSVMYEAQGLIMSLHLLMEENFFEFMLPMLKKHFSFRSRVADMNNVRLYLLGVDSDVLMKRASEVTSLAHVMLRYALEKEMIDGDLSASDLPDAWMQGMKYYFDKVPANEMEGFLQDDYWARGIFGYLPARVLGAIVAAQIFAAMKNHKTDIFANVKNGDFTSVVSWLNRYVYSNGSRYGSTMMLKKITGRRVDVDSYKNYLVGKYLGM
ncbi:gluzincin family metallopeptidase [Anaplasma bovis]|uniref:carboxypeptidase n=1 Tax=Anaplasma bovis TaxID=186733 RepID=UPI002FF2C2DC